MTQPRGVVEVVEGDAAATLDEVEGVAALSVDLVAVDSDDGTPSTEVAAGVVDEDAPELSS